MGFKSMIKSFLLIFLLILTSCGSTQNRQGFLKSGSTSTSSSAESEQSLVFRNQIYEARNDEVQAEFDNKNDMMLHDVQKHLVELISATQNTSGAVSLQEYNENLSVLHRLELRIQESSSRMLEYQADAKVNTIRLGKALGGDFKIADLARAYADLWQARLDKSNAIVGEAQADRDYYLGVASQSKKLHLSQNLSDFDFIRAQRDLDQADIVCSAANELVERNQSHLADFNKILRDM